jgi:hypothetical protein
MDENRPHSGDDIVDCKVIAIHIEELTQLFDSLDPSPFHKKDLDPDAAAYIVSSAQDLPPRARIGLVLYLDKPAGRGDEGRTTGDAVREYFARESAYASRRLRNLVRRGLINLGIGLVFLAAAFTAGTFVTRMVSETIAPLVRESFLIGGWVAMWRPLETFLYDWWPIVAERRLHDRLGRMAVRIVYAGGGQGR